MTSNELATGAPSLRISDCGLRILTVGFAPNPQSAIDNPQLQQYRQRILEHLFQRFQEHRPGRTVDDAVITAHRQAQAPPYDDAIAVGDRLGDDAADRDDAGFGRVDHRGELIDVEHAEGRDAERGAGVFLGLQAAIAGPPRELARLGADFPQVLLVCVADHRGDEPVLDRDGHPDVNLVPVADVIVLEPSVAGAVLDQRQRDGFDDDVVEPNLPARFAELL